MSSLKWGIHARSKNTTTRVSRRPGGCEALRRRLEADSIRSAIHANAPRTCLQKEVCLESEPAWSKTQDQAFGLGPRLPRHGLTGNLSFGLFSGQFLVGNPLANDLTDADVKALTVSHFAVVKSERLFVDVAEEMEGFDANVSSVQATLEQAPKVLHPVSVHVVVHVLHGVVDDGVLVVGIQSVIGKQFIGEDGRARFDVFTDLLLKFLLAAILYNHRPYVSAALHHSHDNNLVFSASPGDDALTLRLMHIAGLAADEGFVDLNLAAQLTAPLALLSKSDPVKHKPRGLLGDAQGAGDLARANAVLAIQDEPHCGKPLIKAERRVFKDSPDLDGELPFSVMHAALPAQLILEEANILATAGRASDAVLPFRPTSHKVVKAVDLIGEVNDGFLKGLRFVGGFHVSSLTENRGLVNYIIAFNWPPQQLRSVVT